MHGIVVETDCGNRAGYPILTVNLYNARGTVAAILFPLLCDGYIAVLWHRLSQISRRAFTAFVFICAFSCIYMLVRFLRSRFLFCCEMSETCYYTIAAVLIAHVLGMDCGNRAGNTFALGDGAEERRHGCRHLSQQYLLAVHSMPLSRAHCFAV